MIRKKQALLLGASTLALMSFAFTAGYGLRELAVLAQGGPSRWVFDGGPGGMPRALGRIASRNGAAGGERDLGAGQVFYEVLDQLQQQAVEKLPPDTQLATGAVDSMLDRLNDVNTRFLEPDEAAAFKGMRTGVFSGLGAVLTIRRTVKADGSAERNITVVAPMPGSPAEKAGLLPGDRITEIDGHWIAPTRLSPRVLNRMTEEIGPLFTPRPGDGTIPKDDEDAKKPTLEEEKQRKDAADTERKKWRNSTDITAVLRELTVSASGKHTLVIDRAGEKPRTVAVNFARTEVTPVTSRMQGDGLGYIRLNQVSAAAAQQFGAAVTELQGKGARSLILDLRRSPGGTLAHAQEIAGRLMASGNLAIMQRRGGDRKLVKQPLAVKATAGKPRFKSIAILVDKGTAGASEALAIGLKEMAQAKLIGEQTFGDGTEQTLFPLDNGAALSITTAKVLSPKETDYDGKGLKPDVAVAAAGDPLEQAVRALRAG